MPSALYKEFIAIEKFRIENVEGTETNELLRLFMFDYYSKNINIPNKIYVSNLPNEDEVIKKNFTIKNKKENIHNHSQKRIKKKYIRNGYKKCYRIYKTMAGQMDK